jgi:hypothetical protein
LYHSERCNMSGTVFHLCYVNDLCTTPCSGTLGHRSHLQLRDRIKIIFIYFISISYQQWWQLPVGMKNGSPYVGGTGTSIPRLIWSLFIEANFADVSLLLALSCWCTDHSDLARLHSCLLQNKRYTQLQLKRMHYLLWDFLWNEN